MGTGGGLTPRALAAVGLLLVMVGCGRAPGPSLPPLRVGTSLDYAPFTGEIEGRADGLDLAIVRRFARDTGRRIDIVRFRWPELVADLAADRFDVAAGGVTIRPERALVGTFTRPVVNSGAVVLVRRGLAQNPQDVDRQGLRLAVNAGGHLERVARRLYPRTLLTAVPDNLALPRLLAAGEVDAVVADDVEADAWLAHIPSAVRLGPFTRDRKAYLAREPGLAAELDAWLRDREADGTLADLRGRWLGPRRAAPRAAFESDVEALLALIELRLAFMPSVAAAKEAMGRRVEDLAREERVVTAARAEAARHGLDPASVAALFTAQIAASRAVQHEWLDMDRRRRPPAEPLDLERDVRPALERVSRDIVARAAAVAADPAGLATLSRAGVAAAIDPALCPAEERRALADAVSGLRTVGR